MIRPKNFFKIIELRPFRKTNLKSNSKVSKIKHQKSILVLQIGILIFFGGYFTGLPLSSGENEESLNPVGLFNSVYSVENLRGDSIALSKYWKIPKGSSLVVNILNPVSISDETISIIKETILSTEKINLEDSLLHKGPENSFSNYYVGWAGALENIPDTKITVPKNFEVLNSQKSNGDIVVILSNIKDRSGNTGYTKTILEGDEIVKAFITIYDIDSLSNTQVATIMRHEFGHALGLGHSTAPEDLMAPTIDMTYPYISECNVKAVADLYDGNSDGTTICEK
ncbi:matrixin family metalloprotease [Nitrosopumilus adriaticus]|uniref:Peptidase M10A and M12B matrixin and adamalysin n=1 Tax=Nitrosopumilus adriaticus TaxID=1580092 RepID=A0A0D5C1T4_9ARCH|nr:matrixin family metalloprotease [Nitrosopumilus adriaticus]AJW70518.1 Peptidase M10A and M12B matrixin and adamalysin [Nitrosopumilus adriaticus]